MTKRKSQEIKQDFLRKLHSFDQIKLLFENLPDIHFFVKDRDGLFIMANSTFCEQCGVTREDELIGKTDHDFFPADRANSYVRDDKKVMSTGKSIENQIELGPEPDGAINWFVVTKIPLYSHDGDIIGIAGAARDMHKANHTLRPYNTMSGVIEYVNRNYHTKINTADLARICSLSPSHFDRRFKQIFGMSPTRYVQKVRIKAACDALESTDNIISTIAQNCGFFDHAHFTKQFVKEMKTTPREYRKSH